jgi:hypothetical protein
MIIIKFLIHWIKNSIKAYNDYNKMINLFHVSVKEKNKIKNFIQEGKQEETHYITVGLHEVNE